MNRNGRRDGGEDRNIRDVEGKGTGRKPPPKQSLSWAPSRVKLHVVGRASRRFNDRNVFAVLSVYRLHNQVFFTRFRRTRLPLTHALNRYVASEGR